MLLSIIIPVYNAERYIRQSLDSILSQSFKDYEILLVNDGSTDGSLSILKEYEKRVPAIRVIDKANEGVSATRNRGIREAKGDYLYFMDADDLLHPKFLSIMAREVLKIKVDLVVCDYATFYTKPRFVSIPDGIKTVSINNSEKQAFTLLAQKGRATPLWNKLFANLLKLGHHPIFLDEDMSFGEDMFFCWKYLLLANNISLIEAPLYLYRQTSTGATSRFHAGLYENYKRASEDIESFAVNKGIMSERIHQDVIYHLTRRLPALTSMESRAPYCHQDRVERISKIVNDVWIQEGLKIFVDELVDPVYVYARKKDYDAMLKTARVGDMKRRILYPIKRLLK